MKIGFYPGCSMEGGSVEYRESCKAIAKVFDMELEAVPDWNCCGASAAHNLNKNLALALPARILALAEKAGFKEILVPCAACYSRLALTQHELKKSEELKKEIQSILEIPYKGEVEILNVVQWIQKYIAPTLASKVVKKFNHDVACYYGCLLVRPHKILNFDRAEDPQSMDEIIKLIGGNPIDWAYKTECCGAGFSVSNTGVVAKLSGKIVEDAIDRNAQAFIVACPMCHSNLDMRRPEINNYIGKKTEQPVIYITQAIGIALGLSEKELGFQRHFVPVSIKEKPEVPVAEKKKPEKVVKTTEE